MTVQIGLGGGERRAGGGQVRCGRADRLLEVAGIQFEQHLPGAHRLPGIAQAPGNAPADLEGQRRLDPRAHGTGQAERRARAAAHCHGLDEGRHGGSCVGFGGISTGCEE
ncbi:hypothetical protein D3C78_1299430 [compost metagenome]